MRIGNTIYLDYQATTPVDPDVFAEMAPFFTETFGNPHSSDHIMGWRSQQAVEHAQAQVARLISAEADEIFFTSGATEANNLALLGGARGAPASKRRILVSAIEHKCVLAAAYELEAQHGFTVQEIPVDNAGFLKVNELVHLMGDDVLLVSVMAVNNEIGTIQDLVAIGGAVKKYDALFHCDAAQAPLACDIDCLGSGIDLLSLSGHKIYGPKGVGALFIRREAQHRVKPILFGGGQQAGFRPGTVPTPLVVGFGTAADRLTGEPGHKERARVRDLRDRFLDRLSRSDVPYTLNGPLDQHRHPGNANIAFKGIDSHELIGALQPNIAAATGAACTSGMPEPSHVLGGIGLDRYTASSSVRFSLGRFTDDAQVDEAVDHVVRVVANVREEESLIA